MSGIGIITNPHSKLNKRNPKRPALLGYILGEQGNLEITQSLDDLRRAARHFKDSDVKILAINGGDGTISQTLTAFIKEYGENPLPRIVLLGGGTMNVISSSLGMRGSPERRLYRLVDGFSSGIDWQTHSLSTLSVKEQYGFLYADGIATTVLEEFYRKKSNAIGAIWLVVKIGISSILRGRFAKKLLPFRKVDIEYQPGETRIQEASLGVFAATIEKMPLGAKLFPAIRGVKKQLQFFTVRTSPNALVFKLAKLMIKTGIQSNQDKFSDTCTSLCVKRDGPFSYTLDGELFQTEGDSLDIKLGPNLEFIVF